MYHVKKNKRLNLGLDQDHATFNSPVYQNRLMLRKRRMGYNNQRKFMKYVQIHKDFQIILLN